MRSRDGGAYHRNREETRMQLDAKSSIPIEQVIPLIIMTAISLGIQAHLCIRMRSRDGGAYHRNREETRMQLDAKSSIPIEQVIPLIIMTSAHQMQ